MESIFTGPSMAFSPFFDSHVAITGARRSGARVHGTFRGGVIDSGFDETVGDNGTVSKRRQITVFVARVGIDAWCYPDPPQLGDRITLEDGEEYLIRSVSSLDETFYTVEARQ